MYPDTEKLTETTIVRRVKEFLINKSDGNWHEEKVQESQLHGHGPDLILVGGKRNSEYFIIECKGKYNKQLFVTTHSPFFVNALSPEQVWVLDKGADGFSTIKRSSEYDFVSDLVQEGAYIGDLWNDKYFG